MSKLILNSIGVVALMALAGCSANDDLNTLPDNNNGNANEDVAVTFGTYVGRNTSANSKKATRAGYAGEMNNNVLAEQGFGVFGYYTNTGNYNSTTSTPNFMYNTQVTKPSTSWEYSPLRYWPNQTEVDGTANDQYVSFFAYAPYVSSTPTTDYGITGFTANNVAGDPTVSYTAKPDDKGNYVDLLWGTKTPTGTSTSTDIEVNKDLTKSKAEKNGTVDFAFKHALAKFGGANGSITILLAPDNNMQFDGFGDATRVTIKKVTIKTSFNSSYESGKLNLVTGQWTLDDPSSTSETQSYEIQGDINPQIAEPTSTDGLTEKGSDGKLTWKASMPKGLTRNAISLFDTSKNVSEILMIPGHKPSCTITIDYIVRTLDPSLASGYTEVEQTVTKTENLSSSLVANKEYGYNISVGLTSVKFDATVKDWVE